jgi:predicted alpha/beta superfamily hydrolase
MLLKRILLCLYLITAASVPVQAAVKDIIIGQKLSLYSDVLNEERPYWVYLPPTYDVHKTYPVIYLLDGNSHFEAASGMLNFMSAGSNSNIQVPEMILVALPNTNRARDFTPTHSMLDLAGNQNPAFKTSGGGAAFLEFFRKELIPHIDQSYATAAYRVLVGHSLGGLFSLYAFLESPDLFRSYIAIDPSLWWDNAWLTSRLLTRLKTPSSPRQHGHTIYMSSANNLELKGPPANVMKQAQERFAGLLDGWNRASVHSRLDYFEDEDHNSIPQPAFYAGLKYIFEGFRPPLLRIIDDPDVLSTHYDTLSKKLGFNALPPEYQVDRLGSFLLMGGEVDKSLVVFRFNITHFPFSARAHESLAGAYKVKGMTDLANQHHEKARELGLTD